GLFATDVAAGADEDFQMEFELAAQDVGTQQALRSRVLDGLTHDVFLVLVLMAYIEDTRACSRHKTGDDHAFHYQVRKVLNNEAIFDGSRLALIRVANHVLDGSRR